MKEQIKLYIIILFLYAFYGNAQQVQYVPLLTDAQFDVRQIDQSKDVGSIKGFHATTQTGAATYTIPIEIPEGINGMTPQLAITYNSQAGNGLLGYGWSLSGLSAIKNDKYKQYYDGITYDYDLSNGNNNLLLDNQRLIPFGDNFVTESESYLEIIPTRQFFNPYVYLLPPQKFLVKDKNGINKEYGFSDNSVII